MKRWYVVQTQPRGEERADFNLRRQGYETFLPTFMKTRRHARKVEDVRRPFFPGYMFVRFDPETTPWRAINSTFGVIGLVHLTELLPTPIADAIVDALLARRRADGTLTFDPLERLARGDRVTLTEGPFAEFEAVFEMHADNDRVMVLLNMMGRAIRVHAPRHSVQVSA